MEFGVYSGESITLMANHPEAPGTVHGFDSFIGLPPPATDGRTDWTTLRFDRGGVLPTVPPHAQLFPGWFEAGLGPLLRSST